MRWLQNIRNKLFPQKWYVVFFSVKQGFSGSLQDYYSIHETKKSAKDAYEKVFQMDNAYCAGWAEIKEGTDHWGM